MVDLVDDQFVELLVQAGVWERLGDLGYLVDMAPIDRAEEAPKSLDDLQADAIRKGLERGDPQMVRAYADVKAAQNAADTFANLVINIKDYRIKDKSLKRIVLDADEVTIEEIFRAFAERADLDECPAALVRRIQEVLNEWLDWAKGALRPRAEQLAIAAAAEEAVIAGA